MKKLIKATFVTTLLAVAGITHAADFNNWHCTTESGDLLSMYESQGHIHGHFVSGGKLSTMGTTFKGESVSYGYELLRNGDTSYVRFNYVSDGKSVDWVVMSGEIPFHSFQGLRVFVDGEFTQEAECASFVNTPIIKHPRMSEDSAELVGHYGQITRN